MSSLGVSCNGSSFTVTSYTCVGRIARTGGTSGCFQRCATAQWKNSASCTHLQRCILLPSLHARRPLPRSSLTQAVNNAHENHSATGKESSHVSLPVLICIPDEYPHNPRPTPSNRQQLGFISAAVETPPASLKFHDHVSFWKDTVQSAAREVPRDQPLYLVGEGTGALIAICVAAQCRKEVQRVVLINTPTAFPSTAFRAFLLLPPSPFSLPGGLPLPWQLFQPSTSPSSSSPSTLTSSSSIQQTSGPTAGKDNSQGPIQSQEEYSNQTTLPAEPSRAPQPTTLPVNATSSMATSTPRKDGGSVSEPSPPRTHLSSALPPSLPSLPFPPFPLALPPLTAAIFSQLPAADVQGAAEKLQALLSAPSHERALYLKFMDDGVVAARKLLGSVSQRTLVLAGAQDALLDSAREADSLAQVLPRCQALVLREFGLSVLSHPAFHLREQLQAAGFYNPRLHFTSAGEPADPGRPGPVELPTEWDLPWVDRSRGGLDTFVRRVCSPVYISTREGGQRVLGVEALPASRPLLVVGNHQLMAPDTAQVIQKVLEQQGLLLRGLAHPALLLKPEEAQEKLGLLSQLLPGRTAEVFASYGAVPVGPSSLYKLLGAGESVLLYPGGEREIYKRQNEKYKLFWPSRAEFVRTAAKFGATIVPLASVGVEECVDVVMDNQQLVSTPFLGPLLQRATGAAPKARAGSTDVLEFDQLFVPPLVSVSVPTRIYFLFQEPIHVQPEMYRDKERCQEVYEQVRTSVQEGIQWLQHKQQQDPYKDFVARLLYENPIGRESRQAPTFKL